MTQKEKKVYADWNRRMTGMADEANHQNDVMKKLAEDKCGEATCNLEYNLDRLLELGDPYVRDRALNIYRLYLEARARYQAMCEVAQALADI